MSHRSIWSLARTEVNHVPGAAAQPEARSNGNPRPDTSTLWEQGTAFAGEWAGRQCVPTAPKRQRVGIEAFHTDTAG